MIDSLQDEGDDVETEDEFAPNSSEEEDEEEYSFVSNTSFRTDIHRDV